jgi:flagellar motor protein MotB
MAMKYVKLFENWLLTEGEDDIDVFVSSKPKKFPVLDTTIGDYWDSIEEDKSLPVMTSFLQRAKQEIGSKEFNTNAGESLIVKSESIKQFDYIKMLDKPGLKKEMHEIFGKDLDINDLDSIAKRFGWDTRSGSVYIVKEGDFTLFFEDTLDDDNRDLPITELVVLTACVIKGKEINFPTGKQDHILLGQILSFVNQGINFDNVAILNSKMKDKGLTISKQIFAGEGKSSLGAFASTVKIGGMSLKLTSGKKGDTIPLYVASNILGTCGFDFNSATLKDEGKETLSLSELGKLLAKGKDIEIVGHTDSVGTEEVNLKLSKQRAESVLKFLQSSQAANIKGKKITTTGVGFKEMITDDKKGKDKDAAAANRRIVIKIDGVGPNYSKLGVK